MEKNSTTTDKKIYVTNEKIIEEVKKSFELGECSQGLAEIFIIMSNNIVKKFKYKNMDDVDDVVQEGIYRALKVWDTIDLDKPNLNPFSYYTQVIKNAQAAAFNTLHNIIKVSTIDKRMQKVPLSLFTNDK